MVFKGWIILLLPISLAHATGTCNEALGLSSGAVGDASLTSPLGAGSTPSAGRLNRAGGAWCFGNDSISSHSAALLVDLGSRRFVSGFGSQGPPEDVRPKSYNHLVAFSVAHSQDKAAWEEFNDGTLYFNADKNDTSDVVKHHVSSTVELTRYVKINVTMHISGSATICLRFEIYGCDTDILPSTDVQALTTPKGKIEVTWKNPSVETTLTSEGSSTGFLRPGGYAVRYKPEESKDFASVATGEKRIALEDVRLGATYQIRLQCLFRDVVVDCGSTQVEAYPPCPEGFTGGNEYHCFLYLDSVSSISDARTKCLNSVFDQQLGTLGYLVDEDEKKFLVARILPAGSSQFWLIGDSCQENKECCTALKIKGDTLENVPCSDKTLKTALCLRDHKGEGAKLRVSSAEASSDGTSAWFRWRYEGTGWKTDELQVKMWRDGDAAPPSLTTFSTLDNTFQVKAGLGQMYSLLLRPAPNIRTEEMVYRFIIIDFQGDSPRYGALLTPVPMSVYIIWSGTLRVTWSEAEARSKSGKAWSATKYSIAHQMTSPPSPSTRVDIESGREFQLTPVAMRANYTFKISCFFAGALQPCGEVSITTDPPDLVLYKPSKVYVVYEVIPDKAKTWDGAEDDCRQRSGHLTSLLDEAEAKALLKMMPNKDSKMWTGAKLGKKGTGYWTDGEKITDLPMAKNSGVTSSSESCCRAINEAGKLKLAGGNCEDKYPYICKYTVQEMMSPPGQLKASGIEWNTFQLSWSKPTKRWMPSFYNVRACLKLSKTNCVVKNQLKDLWTVKLDDLVQFQDYEVQVEAALQPVDVKTLAQISVMTYPKTPVRVTISPKGKGSVSCPILTARGNPGAVVTATVYQTDTLFLKANGGVKDLTISGLTPEETYKLVLKQDGGEWTQEVTFEAVPTCLGRDVKAASECYSLVEEAKSFEETKKQCSEPSERKASGGLWVPKNDGELTTVTKDLGVYSDSWTQKPPDGSLSKIGSDLNCSAQGAASCCFYNFQFRSLSCSTCCDRKLTFICSYKIKDAYLGEVGSFVPTLVGNTSIGVEWSPPDDTSWTIGRFELEWTNAESASPVAKDVVAGATEKRKEGLEFGTQYEVKVTPLGAKKMRGKTAKLLVTTLDPRTPIVVRIGPDGSAQVSSPLLVEKGRGTEQVQARLFRMDGAQQRTPVATVDGQARKVDIETGLEVGKTYWVEMTPKKADKPFNYSTQFAAYPSCEEGQLQEGLVCVWPSAQTRSWTEAYEVCRGENGELLDYKTQKALTQPVKARLTEHIRQRFWLDMGNEGTAALREADSSDCPDGKESEVMCCSYEVSETGELNNLKCSCCDEPRPFACKKNAKIELGDIGNVLVQDVTPSSLTLSWTLSSGSKWSKPSYLVKWSEQASRKKRQVGEKQLVSKESPATVPDLKPGTWYKVSVAPYTEATQSSGNAKQISAVTSNDVSIASLMADSGCTIVILKISCCVFVILGSSITVFVFIATRMFYLDCLAQIFAELGTLGAYVCILVSSAQSYGNDSQCLTADRTLCVAVAVLIQFFFQVIYMFAYLESLVLCTTLKDYLPHCCTIKSHLAMAVCGFGIPAIMMIVLAAIASDGFSDGDDNCWLDLEGTAMLPSVLPVIVSGSISCLLLLSVLGADQPKEALPSTHRGRLYLQTRWGSLVMLVLTSVCYACGMLGVNNRDVVLNYVFVGFSMALGISMPLVRIRLDAEVREQLKRGLFNSMRDDAWAIRVSPAPRPTPLLDMTELDRREYKQNQLRDMMRAKEESTNTQSVYHQ